MVEFKAPTGKVVEWGVHFWETRESSEEPGPVRRVSALAADNPIGATMEHHFIKYEVSVDLYLDNGGWAGVMGRVSNTGSGFGCDPKGYY